jgi:NADH-quinone oxidoreductase subunit C
MVEDDLALAGKGTKTSYKPGSLPPETIIANATGKVPGSKGMMIRDRRGEITVDKDMIRPMMASLKDAGMDHFVALTCIDLIEEGKFELVYNLWSYGSRVIIHVRTEVDRDAPTIETVYDIYRPSITYEREIKEMFGVDFPGNPRLTQFILEDWEGIPPMRKDFDSISYVQEKYDIKVRDRKSVPPGLGGGK